MRRKVWTRQPPYPTRLNNAASGIQPSLVFLPNPAMRELARTSYGVNTGSVAISALPSGVGASYSSGGYTSFGSGYLSSSFSTLIVFSVPSLASTTTLTESGFGLSSDNSQQIRIDTSGSVQLIADNVAAVLASGSAGAIKAGKTHCAVVLWDNASGSGKIFVDGALHDSASPGAQTWSSTDNFVFGRKRSVDTAETSDFTLYLVAHYKSAISASIARDLSRNPWQLFAPRNEPTFFLGPAAGAYTLTAGSGAFALTGKPATLTAARVLAASAGAFTLTGKDATLKAVRAITASVGGFTLSGKDSGLTAARLLSAGVGTFTLTGKDATLTYGQSGAYTLVAQAGTFSLSGKAAELAAQRQIAAGAGTYTLTGYSAALGYLRGIAAGTGSFALTLNPATLTTTGTVTATSAPPGGGKSKPAPRRRRVMLRGQMYEVAERDIPALIEAVLRDSTPPGTAEVVNDKPTPPKSKQQPRKPARATQDAPAEQPSIDMVAERVALLQAELTRQAEADVARMLDRVAQRVLAELQDEEDAIVALLFA